MDPEDERPRGRGARRRVGVAYSAELGRRICERVAKGELLYGLLRDPGMPTPQSVARWARERPDFGAALAAARRSAGRQAKGGGVWRYCEETAQAIFERLCDGQSFTAIGRDPTMPSLSTIFYWRRRFPEFEELMQLGKTIQAERFCDLSWELAAAATRETAYLTHVRLTHIRWLAGTMAPRVFRLKPVEPEKAPERLDVIMRRFDVETDPATGERKLVVWQANPETGEVEREEPPRRGGRRA